LSVVTTGASWLSLPSPGSVRSASGWYLIPSADATDYQVGQRFENANVLRWVSLFFTGPDIPGQEASATVIAQPVEQVNGLGSTYVNAWAYAMSVWDDSGGTKTLHLYVRLQADTSLQHFSIVTSTGTPTNLFALGDGDLADAAFSGGRCTALKAWTRVLSAADALAESYSRAPVNASGLYSYVPCVRGSTLGQDIGGGGHDWSVIGTGLSIDAIEPYVFAKPGALFQGNTTLVL